MLRFLKSKGILFVGLVLFIGIVVLTIFYIDGGKNFSLNNQTEPEGLEGYNELNKQATTFVKENAPRSSQRISTQFGKIADKNLSDKEKYEATKLLFTDLIFVYADTNNPEAAKILDNIISFAKDNFPKEYNEEDDKLYYPCLDESCADSPQPPEILTIIEDIKESDLDPRLKESVIEDLTNTGYRSKDEAKTKVYQYLLIAEDLKENAPKSPTNVNAELADKIIDFVKTQYPDEYINDISTYTLEQ
ncbi:MAG: hypothetical protein HY344_00880 [Candidatus Levybacteria bacterium]|nr:hypothetical protein [Candidatus Levybacteria bacterium]